VVHSTCQHPARQIETLRRQFAQDDGLAFADVLPAERVEQAVDRGLREGQFRGFR
jgi:hypothetical protein